MIDCLLFNVQRAVFQLYSRREQVQHYIQLYKNEKRDESPGLTTFDCH